MMMGRRSHPGSGFPASSTEMRNGEKGEGVVPGRRQQANGVTAAGLLVLVVVLLDHVTKHQQEKKVGFSGCTEKKIYLKVYK